MVEFKYRTISPISRRKKIRHLNTTIGVAMQNFGRAFWKFYHKGSFFEKAKFAKKISRSCDFKPS